MDPEPRRPLLAQCERREPPTHPSKWPGQGPHRHGDHRTKMHFRSACASPAAVACPARELAWPLAGHTFPANLFCPAGVMGGASGVHDSLSSGFNVLYLFGADKAPIKGWNRLWLCLQGPGSRWEDPAAAGSGGSCSFSGAMSLIPSGFPRISQALHHQRPVQGLWGQTRACQGI